MAAKAAKKNRPDVGNGSKLVMPYSDHASDAVRKAFGAVKSRLIELSVGQEDSIDMALLCVLSRNNCLFIGPWGCNKTGLIEQFVHIIGANERGAMMAAGEEIPEDQFSKYSFTFKVTLSKWDQPESLLGPISVKAMREDRWERNILNTLADCDFAYLGEVFSGSPATLRTTVRALNERVVEIGGVDYPIRLRSVFADTNDDPVDSMLAVYDRFLLRLPVGYSGTSSRDNFERMMTLPKWNLEEEKPLMTLRDVDSATAQVGTVEIKSDIRKIQWELRSKLEADLGLIVSDRRWVHSNRVLKASAWLRGSRYVQQIDLYNAYRFILWDKRKEYEKVLPLLEPYRIDDTEQQEQIMYEEAIKTVELAKQMNTDQDYNMAVMTLRQYQQQIRNPKYLREIKTHIEDFDKKVQAGVSRFFQDDKEDDE